MNKITNFLGICRRAGKLISGFDPVCESALKNKAKIILIASDLSEKTKKELIYALRSCDIPIFTIEATMDEIHSATGRRAGVLSTEDENFADKLSQIAKPFCKEDN